MEKNTSGTEAKYNFIKALEDQVIRLARNVQSDKVGRTTGHICMVMPATEFVLIQGTTVFVFEAHPGVIEYLLPNPCTTVRQHTERKYEHTEKLQVFKMEHTLDEKLKAHVSSCLDEDDCIDLKNDQIGYTNLRTK